MAEATATRKRLDGVVGRLVSLIAVALSLFVLYSAYFGPLPNIRHRAVLLGATMAMGFLIFPARAADSDRVRWYDWLAIAGTVAASVYAYAAYWDYMMNPGYPEPLALALGAVLILAILELSRRCIGWSFTVLVVLIAAYALLGHMLPGRLGHGGARWDFLIDTMYLTTDGVWGSLMAIFAGLLTLFVILSTVMLRTGAGEGMMLIAKFLGGRFRGGAAKVAVVSSALVGSVTGSSVTNVAMTGTFTIPAMRRMGYKPEVAAGIEATASSGGQITPPMMGAGLFLMAEFLGIGVVDVMLAALIPAFLFYVGVLGSVHFDSGRANVTAMSPEELPRLKELAAIGVWGPVVLPFAVLIGMIVVGYSVEFAVLCAVLTLFALYLLPARSFGELRDRVANLGAALADTARPLVTLGVLIAAAGILVGLIGLVGIGVKFSELVLLLAEGSLVGTLLVTAAVVMVLGMGVPTTAAYVLAASVLAVALQKIGFGALEAHMFIFYFATLSAITPPVCPAVFVAAGIAEAPWLKVAGHTVRFAIIKYLLPFMFVFYPELLMQGETATILPILAAAVLGTVAISAAFSGYLFAPLSWWTRVSLGLGGGLLVYPERLTSYVGLALVILGAVANRVAARRTAATPT